jgi:hypothetical protein
MIRTPQGFSLTGCCANIALPIPTLAPCFKWKREFVRLWLGKSVRSIIPSETIASRVQLYRFLGAKILQPAADQSLAV